MDDLSLSFLLFCPERKLRLRVERMVARAEQRLALFSFAV